MLGDCTRTHPVILVIDDSASLRSLLREALTLEGYRVLEAGDGRAGVRLFRENRPDLVLLDIIMPEKDGIESKSSPFPVVGFLCWFGGGPDVGGV